MLDDALISLAAEGGSALVKVMVTDKWESVKDRFARLLGRGDAARVVSVEKRLERSYAALTGLPSSELERVAAEQAAAWSARLVDLLEDEPTTAKDLKNLVDQTRVLGGSSFWPGQVHRRVTEGSRVQQAVQGHGVQVNTLAGKVDPSTRSGRRRHVSRSQRREA